MYEHQGLVKYLLNISFIACDVRTFVGCGKCLIGMKFIVANKLLLISKIKQKLVWVTVLLM